MKSALVYGLVILLLHSGWTNLPAWLLWVVGVGVGGAMLFLDRIAYTLTYPNEQLSQHFNWYLKQKKYGSALSLLHTRRMEQERLVFRSALFMIMWVPLAFFALTSTAGLFGKGVVMGLMLQILLDAWSMLKADPARLHVRLFWMIKRVVTTEERLVFLWIITLLFVFLSFWVR